MNRLTVLKEDLADYFKTGLADFYVSPAHRWLVYSVAFVLSSLGVFAALYAYDLYEDLLKIRLTFKGMYAWHTAANFAICLLIMDSLCALLTRTWGAYQSRSVGKTWIILLGTYLVGFVSQRTLVYWLVSLYSPVILHTHRLNPSQRPGIVPMFLFTLPFWLVIGYLLIRMMLSLQARSEELQRIRIDTILEERARRPANDPPPHQDAVMDDNQPQVPIDTSDGPVGPSQIRYISVEDHYLRIFYDADGTGKETLIRKPLKQLAADLPEDQFVQIHRSHIVNLIWVSGVKRTGRQVHLTMKQDNTDLPVSRYRLSELLPVLDQFLTPRNDQAMQISCN